MKKMGVLLLLLMGGGLGIGYYFWHQATQLPEWYTQNQVETRKLVNVQKKATAIEQKIKQQADSSKNPEIKLNGDELNDLFVSKLVDKSGTESLPKALKGIHTKIENDKLKTGAVVDIKELQSSQLGEREKALVAQLTEKFPTLGDRKIYIGLEGKPQLENNQLKFDSNTRVQLGDLSFTLTEVADRLGIPPEKLQERINVELQLGNLQVKDIEFQNGNAVIKGSANDRDSKQ
jgi:hypothetical protein